MAAAVHEHTDVTSNTSHLAAQARGRGRRGRARLETLALLLGACEASNAVIHDELNDQSLMADAEPDQAGRASRAMGTTPDVAPHQPTSSAQVKSTTEGSNTTTVTNASSAGAPGEVAQGQPSMPTAPAGESCPPTHARAIHVKVPVSWPDSLGIVGGKGTIDLWLRMTLTQMPTGIITESLSCGATIPAQTTTAVAGGYMVQAQVPFAAFDAPANPISTGSASKQGDQLVVNASPSVSGVKLADPAGAWPTAMEAPNVMSLDDDGDGKPGLTIIPNTEKGFSLIPISIFQNEFADELYAAQRMSVELVGTESGCPEEITGDATVQNFDTLIVGCHVKERMGSCTGAEVTFLNDSRPVLKRGASTWRARLVSETASCEEVRALVP
ncbi:MAG TPA: hypothetical protein VFN67_40700 [Polyangiales bacterium]|nr:hypothetical protein [Polyangiales bacterium]